MSLDEPFSKLTPPPRSSPGDTGFEERLRGAQSDIGNSLRSVQDFLRRFKPTEIATADGKLVTALVSRSRPDTVRPTEWFAVYVETSGDSPTVTINEGRILAPDVSGLGSDPPTVVGLLKEYPVPGATLSVEDGSVIYLKLTVTHPAATNVELTAETDDYVSVTVGMDIHRFYSVEGECVSLTEVPTPTESLSYVTLAEISISGGKVEVIPRRSPGEIIVPALIMPVLKSLTATSAIGGANYWTCVDGTPTEVSFLVPA